MDNEIIGIIVREMNSYVAQYTANRVTTMKHRSRFHK